LASKIYRAPAKREPRLILAGASKLHWKTPLILLTRPLKFSGGRYSRFYFDTV
jgi:hypothetical protein